MREIGKISALNGVATYVIRLDTVLIAFKSYPPAFFSLHLSLSLLFPSLRKPTSQTTIDLVSFSKSDRTLSAQARKLTKEINSSARSPRKIPPLHPRCRYTKQNEQMLRYGIAVG